MPVEKILIETYADLLRRGVKFFSGTYSFDCGADACTIRIGEQFGLFLDCSKILTSRDEKKAVVHEWAHITGNATYGVDSPPAVRQKAETYAERKEIKKLVPLDKLRKALRSGYTTISDLAEYFDLDEEDIGRALAYYTGPCGVVFK